MKSIKGNATTQYAIIIVLVIIALIPVLFIFGGTITRSFTDFYNCLLNTEKYTPVVKTDTNNPVSANISETTTNKTDTTTSIKTSSKPIIDTTGNTTSANSTMASGSYSTTLTNPQVNCDKGICTINYGDFVLNGIPDNFGGFIEAQGASGGLETIAASLQEIIDSLDEPGDEYLKDPLLELIGLIGTDEWKSGNSGMPGEQLSSLIEIYEIFAGAPPDNLIKNNHPIYEGQDVYYHKRHPGYNFNIKPTQEEIYTLTGAIDTQLGYGADQNINKAFDKFTMVCNNVTNNINNKDYSNYIAVVGALKDYALKIQNDFKNEVCNNTSCKSPKNIELDTIKQKVASKNEDATAYVICKASNVNCK